ncbi:MAG: lipase [Blastocatellia bacterium]|nr:lipase [Blastocatellia bacterium]
MKRKILIIFLLFLITMSENLISYGQDKKATNNRVVLEDTFTKVLHGWVKVERYKIENENFLAEDYPLDNRGDQDGQRAEFFASKQPHSSRFLLYYAPEWDKKDNKSTPILLVHGANDNADRAWANPGEYGFGCGSPICAKTGLMQSLVAEGYRVFAINFPHKHGDNLLWAQQIGEAISRIKVLTNASQVNVIAWSKGAFASRLYASSIKAKWGKDYANDINKLILVGCPNSGIDYAFRHGTTLNNLVFPSCGGFKVNGPAVHTSILCQEKWQSFPELSIYTTKAGNFFPGQKQMLRKWDQKFSLPENETDWKTTYYGGKGSVSESLGIDSAIEQGSLVKQVLSQEIPKSINTYLLAGSSANIPLFHNEHTGPSDGLVFLDSAMDKTAIANLSGSAAIETNHLLLTWHSKSIAQISEWLKK